MSLDGFIQIGPGNEEFLKGKRYVQILFDRSKVAGSAEVAHWKRIVRLNQTCPGKLQFLIHIPDSGKQSVAPFVKDVVAVTTTEEEKDTQFFRGTDNAGKPKDVTKDLTQEQKDGVLMHRCDAIVIYSDGACRIKPDTTKFRGSSPDMDDTFEILYVLEHSKGDAATTLKKLQTENNNKNIFAEIPAHWDSYFKSLGFEPHLLESPTSDQIGLSYWHWKKGGSFSSSITPPDSKSAELKYPDDPETTNIVVPPARIVIISSDYGSTDEQKKQAFNQDYDTILRLPGDITLAEDSIVKTIHANMMKVTLSSSDLDRWRKMGQVEAVLEPEGLFSSTTVREWYNPLIASAASLIQQDDIARMRAYAEGRGRLEEQIRVESARFADLTPELQKESVNWIGKNMEILRSKEWPLKLGVFHKQMTDLFAKYKNDSSNKNLVADLKPIYTARDAFSQKRAATEKVFQDMLAKVANLSTTTPQERDNYTRWSNMSKQSESDRLREASWSSTGPVTTTTTMPAQQQQTSTPLTIVLPTPTPEERKRQEELLEKTRADIEAQLKIFKKTEDEKKELLNKQISEQFAIAGTIHDQVRKIIDLLRAKGVTDNIPNFTLAMQNELKCYHSAITVASSARDQSKPLAPADLQRVLDTLRSNNTCLGANLAIFQTFQVQADQVFKTQQEREVQEEIVKMRNIVRKADIAVEEAKLFVSRSASPESYMVIMAQMQTDLERLQTQLKTAEQQQQQQQASQATTTVEDMKTKTGEMQKALEDLVKRRLQLTTENEDTLQTSLLLQQLQGSQINLAEAKRNADESAALAQAHLQRVKLAEKAQQNLLAKTQLLLNPMRTVGVSRTNLDEQARAAIENKRLTLKVLLEDLRQSIDENNSQGNLSQLMQKLTTFEDSAREMRELQDLFEESASLKRRAHQMLQARGLQYTTTSYSSPQPTGTGDVNEDEDVLEDILDDLDAAIQERDIRSLPQLLDDLQTAESNLSADILSQETQERLSVLRAQADIFVLLIFYKKHQEEKKSVELSPFSSSKKMDNKDVFEEFLYLNGLDETHRQQVQPRKKAAREKIQNDMTSKRQRVIQHGNERFFVLQEKQAKAPLNDEFLRCAYLTFQRSLGRNISESEADQFCDYVQDKRAKSGQLRTTLTCKKSRPAEVFFAQEQQQAVVGPGAQ